MDFISSWRSPSNIALIKYWGKHGIQLPRNPSLSFTLTACHTDMSVKITLDANSPELTVLYGGNETPAFAPKIKSFFSRLDSELPWLKNASIVIDSVNTFPHAAGIASSASSMSALALCLCDLDDQINSRSILKDESWWIRASKFARLGSGSACRSLFPIAALWGKMDTIENSNDEYAIPCVDLLDPVFHSFHDAILVVSSGEKTVSSSEGHDLMNDLAYADVRYAEARKNLTKLLACVETDHEMESFISICESEALQLHGLMMMGQNPYMLMEQDTVSIIKEIWNFRKETNTPVCFTLDAGPNVHLLFPDAVKSQVQDFIQSELLQYCQDRIFILDEVGDGPVKL